MTSQNGWAQTATPPASWIVWIDSATVGLVRGRKAGWPSIRYSTRNAERSASPSERKPLGIGRVAHHRVGQVRAPDRLALGPAAGELGLVELVAQLAQRVGHRLGALLAIRAPGVQALAQRGIVVVDQVAQHVQVLLAAVDRGDLHRGNQPHAEAGGRLGGGLHPVDAVVVAQRQQLDAGLGGGGDHLPWLERAVGVQRVALQIEGRRIGAQASRG